MVRKHIEKYIFKRKNEPKRMREREREERERREGSRRKDIEIIMERLLSKCAH